ncbi:MAG TPA: elongation factor G [bacterium]|nr:elongation factor G [bacterium]
MKEYASELIRNIGLFGHGGTGKTALAEALLYTMGVTNRLGKVDDGSTLSDYHPDEIARKISIGTSILHGEWQDWKFNILDVPGYSDFIGEAKGALRVVDLAVLVLNGVQGVEVGTETIAEFAEGDEVPLLFFVNRMDAEHADFDKVLGMAKDRYGNKVAPIQFPVNPGHGFNRVVDLIQMKLLTFEPGGKDKPAVSDIPADLRGKADTLRSQLIESAAENDESLMEAFFANETLNDEELKTGLRKGIASRSLIPVLCGAATLNAGVASLLDFIGAYGPTPLDKQTLTGTVPGGEEKKTRKLAADVPMSAFVFKTVSEAHVGELSLVRVFSGVLKSGTDVMNSTQRSSEKIGQVYLLNGKNRSEIGMLKAGDIGALVKLKHTLTGNTLCDKADPITLPRIVFPAPVISVAVRPKSRGDEDKISTGLHVLHDEDPSFTVVNDPELHQTILSGQGDLHLAVIIGRLKEKYGVDVAEERPKIPYRETITVKADDKYRHKKQTGGAGQFAEVWMRIEPLSRGEGFEFGNEVKGGAISSVFIPSIEKGVKQMLEEGPVAGYRVVDVKAIVYDGKEHPVDSKDIAFQTAGREVFKAAFLKARPILLEPIYDIEVKVPEEAMGDVMGDLSGRRGKIMGMESIGHFQIIKAKVPLAELDQYATTLRSITSGRGIYGRQFSHYETAPKDVETRVIEEARKRKEEER